MLPIYDAIIDARHMPRAAIISYYFDILFIERQYACHESFYWRERDTIISS